MNKLFTLKNKRHLPKPLAWILAGVMRLYAWTFRVRIEDPHGILPQLEARPCVIAIWHNRLIFAAPLFPRRYRKWLAVLISASRDGEYISTLVKCFGINSVRGSSSHGGARALVELRRELVAGHTPVLTVDGPRGPRYSVHPGVVALARNGHAPLVPVLFNARHYWQLHSWDGMQIPWPLTRMTMTVGKPLELPDGVTTEDGCEQVRQALVELTEDKS